MEIGDYVRTKKGILKIRDYRPFKDDKNKLNYLTYGNYTCVLKENIIKSSSNIIDLIEVGDYVNGYKVSFLDKEPVMGKFVQCDYEVSFGTTNHYRFYVAGIKSIVTKEQFESMEYKVGE